MNHNKPQTQNNRARNPAQKLFVKQLLYALALLICNSAGCLASGLAGACALAAAALFGALFKVRLVNSYYMLQWVHLFHKCFAITAVIYYSIFTDFFQGVF